jgi:hypothetical protein
MAQQVKGAYHFEELLAGVWGEIAREALSRSRSSADRMLNECLTSCTVVTGFRKRSSPTAFGCLPFWCELSGCGRNDGLTRRTTQLRNGPALVR